MLDDPDNVVYESVSNKITSFGKNILPNLQAQFVDAPNLEVQDRIQELIQKINFEDIKAQLTNWAQSSNSALLDAILLFCEYGNPQEFDENNTRKKIKNIYQSTWLELNNYLSPIEQINVLSSILYNMYRLQAVEPDTNNTSKFYIDCLLNDKTGNAYSLGILYLILAAQLDIPIYAIDIPDQFLLAYFNNSFNFLEPNKTHDDSILFFIDPTNGMIYTQDDVNAYLQKMNLESNAKMYKALDDKEVLKMFTRKLIQSYSNKEFINNNEKQLLQLLEILEN